MNEQLLQKKLNSHVMISIDELEPTQVRLYQFLPSNFLSRKDFPLPHWAYKPTQIGGCMVGSLRISAKALLYRS